MTLIRSAAIFTVAAANLAFAQRGGELNAETKARLEKAPKFVEMFMPMRDTVVLAANVYLPLALARSRPFCCALLI